VRARIESALPQATYAGVLSALAIGDQRAISPDQWQVFTRTGVNPTSPLSE
jgi:competence protein ComEC